MRLAWDIKNFEFWQSWFEGDAHFGTVNFVKYYLFFMFTYSENFMRLA